MSSFDAVVFDLDGTLADSLSDIGGAMNETLEALGYPTHALDDYRKMVGEGIEVLAGRALPAGEAHRAAETAAAYRARYKLRIAKETRIYPGIAELLDAVAGRGLKLAVLSNKRDDFTVELVRLMFGRWPFAEVRGEREGVPRKPDPTSARDVARALGVKPERCAFVGDTPIDMKTARAAGMRAVGVTWGFRDAAELAAAGAEHVIHTAAELLPILDG